MRALDLFGGREQVERRIREALKAALLHVPTDVTQLEKELSLQVGSIRNILNDIKTPLSYDVIAPLFIALNMNFSDVLGTPRLTDEQTLKFFKDMQHDSSYVLSAERRCDENAGENEKTLSQAKRFEVWSLAMSMNPEESPVSYFKLLKQFKTKSPVIVMSMSEDDKEFLGDRFSAIIAIKDTLYLSVARPDEHAPDTTWREWFYQVAKDMYHCLVVVQKDGHVDFELLSHLCDEAADYFAKVTLTQWNGNFLFPHVKPKREEWTELFERPEKLLKLIRKLRYTKILLLGKYPSEGGKRLRRLESLIRERGLNPVIFGDLHGCSHIIAEGAVRKEVLTVAKLSELVIVEDSEASGHLVELTDLENAKVKTAILRHAGMGSTILAEPFWKESGSFMRLFMYTDDTMEEVLEEVFAWHEKTK